MPPLSEADTRAKLIDPAIYARGWTEDHIKREETARPVEIVNGRARRGVKGRSDYTLRVRVNNVAPWIVSVRDDGPVGEGSPLTLEVEAADVGSDVLRYGFDW